MYLFQDSGCVICEKQFANSSTLRNRFALEKIRYVAIEFSIVSRRKLLGLLAESVNQFVRVPALKKKSDAIQDDPARFAKRTSDA